MQSPGPIVAADYNYPYNKYCNWSIIMVQLINSWDIAAYVTTVQYV